MNTFIQKGSQSSCRRSQSTHKHVVMLLHNKSGRGVWVAQSIKSLLCTWWDEHWVLYYMLANWIEMEEKRFLMRVPVKPILKDLYGQLLFLLSLYNQAKFVKIGVVFQANLSWFVCLGFKNEGYYQEKMFQQHVFVNIRFWALKTWLWVYNLLLPLNYIFSFVNKKKSLPLFWVRLSETCNQA